MKIDLLDQEKKSKFFVLDLEIILDTLVTTAYANLKIALKLFILFRKC
uniref:Uncharacterized protein n=1 Tax=Phyllymenia taiwanensis TaxID=1260292 RepID=R9XZD8_9FLOR|nr:hypothetical protein [Grateloupia taiwanensis]AGO19798.1 hypothetical protein [Grateloupia taiwanensis]